MSSRTSSKRQPQKLTVGRVLFHWRFPVIIVLILIVLCCVLVGLAVHKLSQPKPEAEPTTSEIYQAAVYDTLYAEESELPEKLNKTLVTLDAESTGVDHDENGRVLLCMWHRYPDAYKTGEDITLSYGDVTAVSAKELATWYAGHASELAENPDLRLQQLLGLPPLAEDSSKNTNFTTFWVNPEDVIRPAFCSDVLTSAMDNKFSTTPDTEYLNWFYARTAYYYTQINQTWTRMGYTYDWAENSESEYGLTEFVVQNGKNITVQQTYTTSEYLQQLATNAAASTDSQSDGADASDGDQKDASGDQSADNQAA